MIPLVEAQYSAQIRLILNNTENTVYIPGNDTSDSGDWGSENLFTSPAHNYIASYNNTNILSGLVSVSDQTHSVIVDGNGSLHKIGLNVSLTNSRILLPFTSGDWKTVEDDILNIETGAFFGFMQPSFSYGVGLYLPLKIMLNLTMFNITGTESFRMGRQRLVTTNNGVVSNKTVIDVRSI